MDERDFVPAEVAAGFPSPGREWQEPVLDIRQLLGRAGERSAVWRMAGTALLGVGIHDKDLVLLSSLVDPQTNDIVVARLNGAIYVRRYIRTARHLFLISTEPEHIAIRVASTDRFRIIGVLLCSIHPIHPEGRTRLRACQLTLSAVNTALGLHEPSVYCSKVSGHSMHNGGILEGDILVIERGKSPQAGDIVVAFWNSGYLVKRLVHARETVFLLSENPLVPPLIVAQESEMEIWGPVLFSIHPLHAIVKQRLDSHRHRML